jgi:hypothetical protein
MTTLYTVECIFLKEIRIGLWEFLVRNEGWLYICSIILSKSIRPTRSWTPSMDLFLGGGV